MRGGEELVEEPFRRLIQESELGAYVHDGFWASMDTFKEKQILEDIYNSEEAPWQVWR
jgi:glucose-1-phosphate cytidylyltransferase